jgi:hypothetical protein
MTQTATKEITILARYALKNSDTVIYNIRNGDNKEYHVGLHASGHTTCTCKHGQNAGNFAHCYHVQDCQKAEAARNAERKMDEMAAYYQNENARRAALHATCNVDGLNDY